jgi:hypothetical protein
MRLVRLRTAGLVVLPVTVIALVAPAASAATPQAHGIKQGATQAVLMAGQGTGATTAVGVDSGTDLRAAPTAVFQVTYHNFSPQAQASFQRAVNTWARTLTSSVPITVDATYKPLGSGVLGSAGAGNYFAGFSGAPKQNVFYPEALGNKLHGSQLDSTSPDIVANFSSSFDNWHFGTTKAPVGKYDFQSVVTHELGHGLGFLGFGRLVDANTGSLRLQGRPAVFDPYVRNGAGKALTTFADPSAALKNQITGGNLYFVSPDVAGAASAGRAKLYAPAEYQPGSSYSHLDENTYRQGNPNSLMTPQLNDGETIRVPGVITKAVFTTIGW